MEQEDIQHVGEIDDNLGSPWGLFLKETGTDLLIASIGVVAAWSPRPLREKIHQVIDTFFGEPS